MESKTVFKIVLAVCVAAVVIFLGDAYFSLQREITAQDKQTERVQLIEQETTERALQVEDKETERVIAIQEEKTHRTEERTKAWNFPWSNTDGTTFTREKE